MKTIIFGTAHLKSTPGKRSPDGKFLEYQYSRQICKALKQIFERLGYVVFIDVEEDDLKMNQVQELRHRCDIVNSLHKKYKDCIYISIHVNAAGADGKWHNATGWEAYTSPGRTQSDKLAECLYNAAEELHLNDKEILKSYSGELHKLFRKNTSDGDKDIEADFYIIKGANCPAVLTENFFQDNKKDVELMESQHGKDLIIQLHVNGIEKYVKSKKK